MAIRSNYLTLAEIDAIQHKQARRGIFMFALVLASIGACIWIAGKLESAPPLVALQSTLAGEQAK